MINSVSNLQADPHTLSYIRGYVLLRCITILSRKHNDKAVSDKQSYKCILFSPTHSLSLSIVNIHFRVLINQLKIWQRSV